MTHTEAWKFIITEFEKIQDPVLRREYIANARFRAIEDWGFDPTSDEVLPIKTPENYAEEVYPRLYKALQIYKRFEDYDELQSIINENKEEQEQWINYFTDCLIKGFIFKKWLEWSNIKPSDELRKYFIDCWREAKKRNFISELKISLRESGYTEQEINLITKDTK